MSRRTFQQRIIDLRTDNDMSQADLANVLNITQAAVGFYETGVNKPTYEIALQICDYFNVTLDYLFGRVDFNARESNLEELFVGDISIGTFVDNLRSLSNEEREFIYDLTESISDYRIDSLRSIFALLHDVKK